MYMKFLVLPVNACKGLGIFIYVDDACLGGNSGYLPSS